MKLKNALPAGVNHHAATKLVEKKMNTIADAAMGSRPLHSKPRNGSKQSCTPRPRGPNDHSRPKNATLLAIDTKGLLSSVSCTDRISNAIAAHRHVSRTLCTSRRH